MRRFRRPRAPTRRAVALMVYALAALVLAAPAGAQTTAAATVDFEGLAAGTLVTRVSSGAGVTGATIAGHIDVSGVRHDTAETQNAAMVFDARCGGDRGTCSGGETDMFFPELGNVLALAESLADANGDGRVDVPAVWKRGGVFTLDLRNFGPGAVRVDSLDVLDIDESEVATIRLYCGGMLLAEAVAPPVGNAQSVTVSLGGVLADRIEVELSHSGGIDNLKLTVESPPPPPPPPPPTPPPPGPPPPPPPVFKPPVVCERLTMSRRTAKVGVRTTVRVRVVDQTRRPMAGVRVIARGAGVRTSARTGPAGYARLTLRPRRPGVIRIRVAGSAVCVARIGVTSTFQPPVLTG